MAGRAVAGPSWRQWARQLRVVVELELAKHLADRRSVWVYLLALAPVVLLGTMVVISLRAGNELAFGRPTLGQMIEGYANLFEGLILRGVVFLGCVGIFTTLFRGEVLQGSLHYYFLAPIRREVVVVGKYLAGLLLAAPLFGLSALVTLVVAYVPLASPAEQARLPGLLLSHGASYLAIVILACLGYGAVFLFMGLLFRNPILPAAVILGWEYINFLLPPVLKKISIVHYLRSLRPVAVSEGPFALLADPTPAWLAVTGLLGVAVLFVAATAVGIRRVEIDYGD